MLDEGETRGGEAWQAPFLYIFLLGREIHVQVSDLIRSTSAFDEAVASRPTSMLETTTCLRRGIQRAQTSQRVNDNHSTFPL